MTSPRSACSSHTHRGRTHTRNEGPHTHTHTYRGCTHTRNEGPHTHTHTHTHKQIKTKKTFSCEGFCRRQPIRGGSNWSHQQSVGICEGYVISSSSCCSQTVRVSPL